MLHLRMASLLLLLATLAVGAGGSVPAAAPQPPLEVVIYFESLCPDCQGFISGSFASAWRAVPEILNVTLVPWGFAKAERDGDGWRFTCQHGPKECRGNKLHACGVRAGPAAAAVSFSVCLEAQQESGETCAGRAGLDWTALHDCLEDRATDAIMLQYRDMTEAARPEISWVPTVSVDGSRDRQQQMQDHFLRFVCDAWQGDTPPGCAQAYDRLTGGLMDRFGMVA